MCGEEGCLQLADRCFHSVQQLVGFNEADRSLGLVAHVDVFVLELDELVDLFIGDGRALAQLELAELGLRDPDAAGGQQQLDEEDLF